MSLVTRVTYLWPGLPSLWWRGDWNGLAIASGFALVLNFSLIIAFIWPEWVGNTARHGVWLTTATMWLVGFVWSWHESNRFQRIDSTVEDLLRQAQREYLRGNWHAAEVLLKSILHQSPKDADVMIMLSSVYRRAGRSEDSRLVLQNMERLDSAEKWQEEISREHELLERLTAVTAQMPPSTAAKAA